MSAAPNLLFENAVALRARATPTQSNLLTQVDGRKSYMKNDVYQIVTDRIIGLLESGTVPWHRPWRGIDQWAQNLVSRKPYRGINQFLLNATKYPSPFWLTFRQVHLLGGSVKKGERSFPVVFWKRFKEEGNEDARTIPFLRYYAVFNVAQCEGINVPVIPEVEPPPKFARIEKCEWIVSEMPAKPIISHHGSVACYSPSRDEISIPEPELFESMEAYYTTLFHELTHSTGHLSRLNRKEVAEPIRFGSEPYSREELVAEMGAAFLCGRCEIENKTVNQSASYIQSWLEKLKDDRKLVVHAAVQAQKACDFILDIQREEEEGPSEPQPKEFKVVALRECPVPESMRICDTAETAAQYWRLHVTTNPYFNPDCECFVVLLLNTRRRVRGHQLVTIGTLDTVHIHPRDVFRTAVIDGGVAAVILMHNHPSGEPQPSDADVKITRDLIRAGQLMQIEVLDHIVMGNAKHCSLRELGHFYS
jgi:antirestriction protein ArdC/proteasome lid subunit RPN8/RPN11